MRLERHGTFLADLGRTLEHRKQDGRKVELESQGLRNLLCHQSKQLPHALEQGKLVPGHEPVPQPEGQRTDQCQDVSLHTRRRDLDQSLTLLDDYSAVVPRQLDLALAVVEVAELVIAHQELFGGARLGRPLRDDHQLLVVHAVDQLVLEVQICDVVGDHVDHLPVGHAPPPPLREVTLHPALKPLALREPWLDLLQMCHLQASDVLDELQIQVEERRLPGRQRLILALCEVSQRLKVRGDPVDEESHLLGLDAVVCEDLRSDVDPEVLRRLLDVLVRPLQRLFDVESLRCCQLLVLERDLLLCDDETRKDGLHEVVVEVAAQMDVGLTDLQGLRRQLDQVHPELGRQLVVQDLTDRLVGCPEDVRLQKPIKESLQNALIDRGQER